MPQHGKRTPYPAYEAVPFATYDDVCGFLQGLDPTGAGCGYFSDETVSLGAVARCLRDLKRPDLAFRSIHVTGTNGKTTVCRMIAALLQAAGATVGLYTSPHVAHFRERVAVNGAPISEQALVDACNRVKAFLDWEAVALTSFEFLTAAAFFAFRTAKVEYAVIEVGIGGRQDATNVLAPDVSVVTNVAFDHMQVLGDTVAAIAAEKAGIVKPFTPVVCGSLSPEAQAVILARADELRAPVLACGRDYAVLGVEPIGGQSRCAVRVGNQRWQGIPLRSPAPFAATNAAHALAAYDVLRQRGLVPALGEAVLRTVWGELVLPACCEVIPGTPTVVVDGAHNAPALGALVPVLLEALGGRRLVLLVSILADKAVGPMIRQLLGLQAERAVFTRYPFGLTVNPEELAGHWREGTSAPVEVLDDSEAAMKQAVQSAGPDGVVLVTGSTQFAGYCRRMVDAWEGPLFGRESETAR